MIEIHKIIIFLSVLFVFFHEIHCANILFLIPIAFRSETHLFSAIATRLADKGHRITYISPVGIREGAHANITHFAPVKPFTDLNFCKSGSPLQERVLLKNRLEYMSNTQSRWSFIFDTCHQVWNHPKFIPIVLHDLKFDLVFTSSMMNNCFNGLIYKLKVPFVSLSSVPIFSVVSGYMTGFHFPPSFVPHPLFDFTDNMTFAQRLTNTLLAWMSVATDSMLHYNGTLIYRKYLEDESLPYGTEIEKNVAVAFSHSHPLLNFARPLMPNTIEIGGLQCKDAKPLPKDLDDFVSKGGPHGFIYFSLGTSVTPGTLPASYRQLFLAAFAKLKQQVIWKWNHGTMDENVPNNVMLAKWLPQEDVLGHPQIRLYIMQGGLLSLMEAMHHGVPILGLPVFGDQDGNMMGVERLGFGRSLEILDLTEHSFTNAIINMLSNTSYSQRAKEVKEVFRDHSDNGPLERAVYWTEYALKHKGANHLKSHARNLNYFQYNSFDILACFGAAFGLAFLFWSIIMSKCLVPMIRRKIKGGGNEKEKTN